MNDQELRQMIRDSIARHAMAQPLRAADGVAQPFRAADGVAQPFRAAEVPAFTTFPMLRSGDADGACVIEPAVRCNHCGYCLSYGH